MQRSDLVWDVYQRQNGRISLCGKTQGPGGGAANGWVITLESNGQRVWSVEIGEDGINEEFHTLIELDGGDIATAGQRANPGNGATRPIVVRLDGNNGGLIWSNQYEPLDVSFSTAQGIIETKAGQLAVCGWGRNGPQAGKQAFLMLIRDDGELIWSQTFANHRHCEFQAMREVEGGFLLAGSQSDGEWDAWLVRTDEAGEVVWEQNYGDDQHNEFGQNVISCPNGGWALVGTSNVGSIYRPLLLRTGANGDPAWNRVYDIGEERWYGMCIQRDVDEGFIFVGYKLPPLNQGGYPWATGWVIKTEPNGNEMWRSTLRFGFDQTRFQSIVLSPQNEVLIAGDAYTQEDQGSDYSGLLVKLRPSRRAPLMIFTEPDTGNVNVLVSDEVRFAVHAIDLQDDVIFYEWRREDEVVSQDTFAMIDFPTAGDFQVTCQVSDEQPGDLARWLVRVRDILIASHTPDTLSLTVQRNSEINFALDSVAYIGDLENLRYEWMIYDSTAVRWEEVAGDDRIGIRSYAFDRTGGYALKARVFDPNVDPVPADSVQWAIQVRGVIRAYEPNTPEISLEPRLEATFELIPFNANNDSIEFWWTLDEADDTLSILSTLSISFADTGRYVVSGYAREQVGEEEWEEDVQRWVVNVGMLSVDDFGLDSGFRRNDDPLMISIAPNPFNDQAMVMIDLGGRAVLPALRADKNVRPPRAQVGGLLPVRLGLYAIDGREVIRLHDGPLSPGSHTFSLSHFQTFTLPSGIYFLRLQAGSHSRTVKSVLMR
ncbi:MAG: hypothetical protein FJY67_04450 [Calditrichaeota bacterium]|nr:hypothetical protein [Calditrichota bacterium]